VGIRRRSCLVAGLAWVALTVAVPADVSIAVMNTPPDPDEAVRAEYRGVQARGTAEAYELFIERHPDHPLANEARRELKRLRRQ
jgi:hypothetical protein